MEKWEIKHKKEKLSIAHKLLKTAISHFINVRVKNVNVNVFIPQDFGSQTNT